MILPKPYTWVELSKKAFDHNTSLYKKLLNNKKLAAVVKANAYGHGLLEIGSLCETNPHIDILCTSHLSEALTLRAHGIKKPILVLSIIDEEPRLALGKDIHLTVYDQATLTHLSIIGQAAHQSFNVHLKIDTGMSRFGFLPEEAAQQVVQASQIPFITIAGLYTHCSDPNNAGFTKHQLEQFVEICDHVETLGIEIPYKHAGNTAVTGAYYHAYPSLNLARIGAGLYGFWHSRTNKKIITDHYPDFNLKPVLKWKTIIMHIRAVHEGAFIGYDRIYQATRPTNLAILPVGYKESYDRKLATDTRFVYINDQPAPIIGRVCMNATLVDITSLTSANEGDEVTLIGDQPFITPLELSALVGSKNPREIPTALDPTIPRIIKE